MKKVLPGLVLISLFAACKRSNKDKLTNKWVVRKAVIYKGNKNWENDTIGMGNIVKAMENNINGQVYDLHADGKFITSGKVKTVSGTWDVKDGTVQFLSDDFKQAIWNFKDNKIEIGQDSSLVANLQLGKDSMYVQLTLKPAPGQAIKVDN